MLHKLFQDRQEFDYRELVESSRTDAVESVKLAKDFLDSRQSFKPPEYRQLSDGKLTVN